MHAYNRCLLPASGVVQPAAASRICSMAVDIHNQGNNACQHISDPVLHVRIPRTGTQIHIGRQDRMSLLFQLFPGAEQPLQPVSTH